MRSSEAISTLAAIMPDEDVNKAFRTPPSKFDLLNGWRLGDKSRGVRTAYRRGRWFLIRNDEEILSFSIRSPVPANFSVFLDAKPVQHLAATAEWQKIAVDLTCITPSMRYVLEIRRDEKAADFDSNCFQVKKREVHRPGLFWHLAQRLLRRTMEFSLPSKH